MLVMGHDNKNDEIHSTTTYELMVDKVNKNLSTNFAAFCDMFVALTVNSEESK